MMWKVLGTVGVGGLIILVYKIINHIGNCYLFKTPYYQPRYNIVRDYNGCVKAVLQIFKRHPPVYPAAVNPPVLGMDCEMTSTSVNGGCPVPALLQLAKPDGYCAIFQLKLIKNRLNGIRVPFLSEFQKYFVYELPSEDVIRQVLEDPNILKVGVAVLDDAKYIEQSYGIICKGCLDVRHLAQCVGILPKGLGFLAKIVLGKEKIEIKQKKKAPWEAPKLYPIQIEYALQDARLGVDLFLKLNEIMIERSYSRLRRLFWDENTYWKYTMKLWRGYIGKQFDFPSRGELHRRPWSSSIPPPFMMNPNKKYTASNMFNLESGSVYERLCFVCGILDNGTLDVRLKAMVPLDYHLELDDQRLYYICLCSMCLEESRTKVDYVLRQELTEELGSPYPDYTDHRLETAKKVATELLSCGDSWNQKEWVHILEGQLHKLLPDLQKQHFHVRTMEVILSMDCWPGSDHGRFIRDYCELYEGGLEELQWRWCERFYKVMRPQYLPQIWKKFYRSDYRWHWIMT